MTIDTTTTPPEEAATTVLGALDRLGRRWRRVPGAARRLDLRASGQAGPAFSIHRPFSPLARAGAVAGRAMFRVGLTPGCAPPFPGLDDLLDELEVEADGLVAFRSSRQGRWVMGIAAEGRLTMVVKVGPAADSGLRNEADVLERLHGRTVHFDVPRIRACNAWRDRSVLVTDARPCQHAVPSVDDAAAIATELTRGPDDVGPIVHGDLTPWNIDRDGEGRLYVVDWEGARSQRAPLHDLSHFVVRAGSLLGTWTPRQGEELLTGRGSLGARHLEDVGVSAERAVEHAIDYLDRTSPGSHRESTYRRELRRALEERRRG